MSRTLAEIQALVARGAVGWSPYLSIEEAKKLDTARLALRNGDVAEAAKYGRVIELMPVSG